MHKKLTLVISQSNNTREDINLRGFNPTLYLFRAQKICNKSIFALKEFEKCKTQLKFFYRMHILCLKIHSGYGFRLSILRESGRVALNLTVAGLTIHHN